MKSHRITLLVSLLLAFLLVGCAGEDRIGDQPQTGWQQVERQVRVVGSTGPTLERTFTVYLPAAHAEDKSLPLIFGFHGAWGDGETFARQSDLLEASQAERFIMVFPDGYRRSWNVGSCCGAARDRSIDEIAFVRAMLRDIDSFASVDRRRVYATGFSNGAMLTYRLACDMANEIAAIGPAGAAMQSRAAACTPARPVPVMHFHGKADEWAPYEGGASEWDKLERQPSIPSVIAVWARKNNCESERERKITGDLTCLWHSDCAQGAEVVLCAVPRLGHQWAGDRPRRFSARRLGSGRPDVPASEILLDFFLDHPMPRQNRVVRQGVDGGAVASR